MVYRKLRPVDPDGIDPFSGADNAYDPDKFYVEACDRTGKAESTTKQLKIPAYMATEISRLIASGNLGGTPIQHFNDAVRDALVHWMHKISVQVEAGKFTESAERARLSGELDAIEVVVEGYRTDVQRVRDISAMAMGDGSIAIAQQLVDAYGPILERLPKPWYDQMAETLATLEKWINQNRPLHALD